MTRRARRYDDTPVDPYRGTADREPRPVRRATTRQRPVPPAVTASDPARRSDPAPGSAPTGGSQTATLQLLDLAVAVHSDDPALLALVDALYAPTRVERPRRPRALPRAGARRRRDGYVAAADGGVLVRTPGARGRVPPPRLRGEPDGDRRHATHRSGSTPARWPTPAVRSRSSDRWAPASRRSPRAWCGAGWEYLTDEVAAIDARAGCGRTPSRARSASRRRRSAVPSWAPPAGAAHVPRGAPGWCRRRCSERWPRRRSPLAARGAPELPPGGPDDGRRAWPAPTRSSRSARTPSDSRRRARSARCDAAIGAVPCLRVVGGDLDAACDAVEAIARGAVA